MRTLTLRTIKGKIYKIECPDEASIGDVKKLFLEQYDGEAKVVTLIFKANKLDDAKLIKDIEMKDSDFFIVHIQTKAPSQAAAAPAPSPAAAAPAPKPAAAPAPAPSAPAPAAAAPPMPTPAPLPDLGQDAPQRREIDLDQLAATPEFQQTVQQLMEMGATKEVAEQALKAARGDANLAYHFLENGIPTEDDIKMMEAQAQQVKQIFDKLEREPEFFPSFVDMIEMQSPQDAAAIRANPEKFLLSHNLDPSKYDLEAVRNGGSGGFAGAGADAGFPSGGYAPQGQPSPQPQNPQRDALSKYTPEEREAIARLKEFAPQLDDYTILQVFEACDKNENVAANCLLSMM